MIHLSRSLLKPDPAQTQSEASHTGRCLAWTKRAHLNSRPCSKFCAPEGGKSSLSPGGSNLSRSGTGFWNSISNSALVHELSMQTLKILACSASEMCPASGNALQTFPHAGWSSCLTLVFQHHPPLLSVAGDTWGTLGSSNFTTNTSTVCKVEEKIHGYTRHWNGYSSRESL